MIRHAIFSLLLLSCLSNLSVIAGDFDPIIKNMPSDAIHTANDLVSGYIKTITRENNPLKYWNYVYDADKNYIGIIIRGYSLDNQEPILLAAYRDIEVKEINRNLMNLVVEKTKHQENQN